MLRNADISKVDLVPEGAQQLSKIEILKSKEAIKMDIAKMDDKELDEIEAMLNEIKHKLGISDTEDKSEEDVEDKMEKEDKPEGKPEDKPEGKPEDKPEDKPEGKPEDMESDTDDNVKKALKKAADAEAENSKLKEQIAKMADERENREFIEKAAGMKNIPGMSEAELGNVLKSVYKTAGKETYERLENILKAANEAIGTGSLFVESGTDSNNSAEPQSSDEAWSMLEALAKNRVEKKLSGTSTCMADVLKTDEGAYLYSLYKSLK